MLCFIKVLNSPTAPLMSKIFGSFVPFQIKKELATVKKGHTTVLNATVIAKVDSSSGRYEKKMKFVEVTGNYFCVFDLTQLKQSKYTVTVKVTSNRETVSISSEGSGSYDMEYALGSKYISFIFLYQTVGDPGF